MLDLEEDEDLRQEEQSRKRKFLEDMRTQAAASGFSSLEIDFKRFARSELDPGPTKKIGSLSRKV